MKAEGSLTARDLAELVLDLYEQRFSGLLILSSGGVGKSLTLQDGRMVFASSTSADDRLGELLLRRGRISLRQYVDAGSALAPGKRLGTVLVEQGVLSPKDLVKTVVEQVQEIIYGAFQWTEGQYRLNEGAPPPSPSPSTSARPTSSWRASVASKPGRASTGRSAGWARSTSVRRRTRARCAR